ncbi:MAG: DNA-binding protein [Eubacterium sp.]|nr:DNA-binding protein [Eubacterium sp.]
MEAFVKRSLLYDFYGELLTEHQKQIYEGIVIHDFSVSEIARDAGISRQGVHDLVKRCDRALEEYEKQLHLVEKFLGIRRDVERIMKLAEEGLDGLTQEDRTGNLFRQIRETAADIREEL